MTIANTWTIQQMKCYPEVGGLPDVVFTVTWKLYATDGVYPGSVMNETIVTIDPNAPYTPYSELTEAQVIGWVKDSLGPESVAKYESIVAAQIDAQANPPVITLPLPWAG